MEESGNDNDSSTSGHFKFTKGGSFEPVNTTVSALYTSYQIN